MVLYQFMFLIILFAILLKKAFDILLVKRIKD